MKNRCETCEKIIN